MASTHLPKIYKEITAGASETLVEKPVYIKKMIITNLGTATATVKVYETDSDVIFTLKVKVDEPLIIEDFDVIEKLKVEAVDQNIAVGIIYAP